jgi:sialidase-1
MIRAIHSRSNWFLVLVVVALVLGSTAAAVPGAVSAQSSGSVIGKPNVSFATSTGAVTAGTRTDLTLSITNRGQINHHGPAEYEDQVRTARAMTVDFDDRNVPIDVDAGQLAVGNVPVGSVQKSVPITVDESADPGTYRIPFEYEYQQTFRISYDSTGIEDTQEFTRTRSGSITVEIKEDARFEVVGINGTAQVGDDSEVEVSLRNTGTQAARNANVVAVSRSAALTFDSASRQAGASESAANVGDWEPGEVQTVTYQTVLSADASVREYVLDLRVDYEDESGIEQTARSLTAGVDSIPEQSFALSNVTSSLRVGEEGDIVGTVENEGPQAVNSVVVRYADDVETLVPVERSVAVGALDAGESATFTLPVEVSSEARSGAKSISFDVRYRTADNERRTYDKLDVRATVAPKRNTFDVRLVNRTIEAGGSRVLAVEVTNNLDETVTDVEGRLFANDPLDTGGTDTGYIASLDPGETTTVTFELTAAGSATPNKTYPISFDFRYDDREGNSYLTDTVRVPVDVTAPPEGGLPLVPLGGAAVLVLLLGGIWLWSRN